MMRSHLLLSIKVLQLISSVYTIITGTMCGQQGSGSSWVEYLQTIKTTESKVMQTRSQCLPLHHV